MGFLFIIAGIFFGIKIIDNSHPDSFSNQHFIASIIRSILPVIPAIVSPIHIIAPTATPTEPWYQLLGGIRSSQNVFPTLRAAAFELVSSQELLQKSATWSIELVLQQGLGCVQATP